MADLSAFAGAYGREIRPQRIPIGSHLLEAAISGDTKTLASLLSLRSAPHDDDHHQYSSESTVLVIPTRCPTTHESNNEIIFGVTAGGDTVLHIAAEHGQLEFADKVCIREPSLIAAVNIKLETPLHCCARAGYDQIVSLIIKTARDCTEDGGNYGLLDVVRARNVHGETALHEASRFGHVQVVDKLMAVDDELANYVSDAGISPLYLAVMRNSPCIVNALLQHSSSFAGPGGQTALHAAVTRSQEITRMLLKWKVKLGRIVDEFESTPLHYVAADGDEKMAGILLEHDESMAYISDKDGYYPIHVAAGMGHVKIIDELLKHCPDSFDLLDDYKGRNFLHIAAEEKRVEVVRYVCNSKNKKHEKLLNQRDNINGNTPLHLVVSNDSNYNHDNYKAVAALLKDPRVETSIINNQGRTQLDLSYKLEPGMGCHNIQAVVLRCLVSSGAVQSPQRSGHVSHESEKAVDVDAESRKRTTLSRNMAIASVLAATVTFAAGFTMPGGYNSTDGTTVLSNYPFKAFLISNTCAMVCSIVATVRIIYAGTPMIDNTLRKHHLQWSMTLLWISFACMAMAFSMATYAVVVPKSWRLGVLVCMISFAAPVVTAIMNREQLIYMWYIMAVRNKTVGLNLDSLQRTLRSVK